MNSEAQAVINRQHRNRREAERQKDFLTLREIAERAARRQELDRRLASLRSEVEACEAAIVEHNRFASQKPTIEARLRSSVSPALVEYATELKAELKAATRPGQGDGALVKVLIDTIHAVEALRLTAVTDADAARALAQIEIELETARAAYAARTEAVLGTAASY